MPRTGAKYRVGDPDFPLPPFPVSAEQALLHNRRLPSVQTVHTVPAQEASRGLHRSRRPTSSQSACRFRFLRLLGSAAQRLAFHANHTHRQADSECSLKWFCRRHQSAPSGLFCRLRLLRHLCRTRGNKRPSPDVPLFGPLLPQRQQKPDSTNTPAPPAR